MTAQPTIQRPNGKPYRPRKAPSVREFSDLDDNTGVVVLRTHDIQLATELASDAISEHDLSRAAAYTTWWRLVPFDPSGYFDRTWQNDPVRGVPCVVFAP
jgi:hypothetical protein